MQRKLLKDFFYKVLIPCCFVLLVFYAGKNINLSLNKDNLKIKIIRNTVSIIPRINWMIGWSDQPVKRDIIQDFAQEYEFKNQNIKINLGYSENINKSKHAREIAQMIQNSVYEWDIVWVDESVYFQVSNLLNNNYWGEEYLVDFQKIEGFALSQRPEILQNKSILKKMNFILPGPYLDGFYGVIWYNKEVASMLGLEVKDRDMNFKDILKYAQIVSDYNKLHEKKIALFCDSKDWFTTSMLFQHLIWGELDKNSNTIENDSLTHETDSISDFVYLKKILTLFGELGEYKPLIESHNVNMWYDAKRIFLDNGSLFMIGKTDLYNELLNLDAEKAGYILPAELPSLEQYNGYIGSFQPSFCVFKSAPNRDAAIELMKSLSTPYYAEKWANKTKNPTGISVNINENYLENDPYNEFLIYIARKYQYNVRYSIDASYMFGSQNAHLYNIIDDNLRLILSNQITSEEAFNNITSNISE